MAEELEFWTQEEQRRGRKVVAAIEEVLSFPGGWLQDEHVVPDESEPGSCSYIELNNSQTVKSN